MPKTPNDIIWNHCRRKAEYDPETRLMMVPLIAVSEALKLADEYAEQQKAKVLLKKIVAGEENARE